jgi:GT2 family glycosyltransferase
MSAPLTTVIVAPRERFGSALESLDSLIENTAPPYALVYVDAGSPRAVRQGLLARARRWNFTLLRTGRYLSPNQARNAGLAQVRTKFVAFVDNDVVFAPGWLEALERCAEEAGADIVVPVTCIGRPEHTMIHHAGGAAGFLDQGGRRVFHEAHHHGGRALRDAQATLERGPTEMAEFHTVLVRAEVFERLGPLDERLMSNREHIDLCMAVRASGGKIVFEPGSVVTYVPRKLRAQEVPFFMLRWSDRWTRKSNARFLAKWRGEDAVRQSHTEDFVWRHRGHGLPAFRRHAIRWAGWRLGVGVIDWAESVLAAVGGLRHAGLGGAPSLRIDHAGAPIRVTPARPGDGAATAAGAD